MPSLSNVTKPFSDIQVRYLTKRSYDSPVTVASEVLLRFFFSFSASIIRAMT